MAKVKASDISLKADAAKEKRICKSWPVAKVFLTDLQAVIKNPIAKMGIGIAITAGETIVATICPAKPEQ